MPPETQLQTTAEAANPAPPDIQPQRTGEAPPPLALGTPTPAPPPKETFGQGFRRGAAGETYFVDAQGNVTSARRTGESGKGTFGSILAGAVMGALAGAHSARPGGIPSSELGGGAGQGAKAAADYLQQRDDRARGRAQQDFQNRQVATEAKNKDLLAQAQIHIANLSEIKLAHEIGEAQRDDPLRHTQLVNATEAGQLSLETEIKNLGLLNERTYKDYADVPKADIDKFNRHEVKLLALPDGSVKVWDRTFDPQVTPNTADFEVKDLVGLDPKTGKPEWKTVGHVKAGSSTAAQQEAELDKERTQLAAAAESNARVAKEKAEAFKDTSQAVLNQTQAKLMSTLGVNVPAGYQPPAGLFQMSQPEAAAAITKSGATTPPDFAAMYAIGHYDADLKTLPSMLRKGVGQRDRAAALTYIRTFINPNFDEKNYDAVKELEKEFASTKPNTAGGNLISFNTAIGHLGQLYEASQALAKNDVTALNTVANAVGAAGGKDAPKVYDGIRSVLVGEAGRLFKQAAPDVKEMAELNEALGRSNSPEQFRGVAAGFAHAFLTKGANQIFQYYNYTGKLPPSTFNPNMIKTLRDLGIDISRSLPTGAQVSVGGTANTGPQQPGQGSGEAPPPAGATVKVPGSDGKMHWSDEKQDLGVVQ